MQLPLVTVPTAYIKKKQPNTPQAAAAVAAALSRKTQWAASAARANSSDSYVEAAISAYQ